jgi:hypothetical protein
MPTGEERRGAVCGKIACTVRCRRREETRPVGSAVRLRRLPPTLPPPPSMGSSWLLPASSDRLSVCGSGHPGVAGAIASGSRCSVAGAIASKMHISAPRVAPAERESCPVYPFRPLSTALVNASNSSAEGGRTCVARIAARSWSGQEYHNVPSPPAQPYRRPAAFSVTPSP